MERFELNTVINHPIEEVFTVLSNLENDLKWHELAIDQRKPEEAVAKYLGPNYRQHNPGATDGPESFIETVKRFAQNFPDFRMEPKGSSQKAITWSCIAT